MEALASRSSLIGDRRGAVLLISVFMAAFLVGALWYAIGIGDAAIYRQYMQDGADAVAFGSAVYHARGMNIIALINLVMAAVLMVLVAFKIGQLLLAAANLASCLLGAFLNPICDLTTAAMPPYANLVMKVEKIVDKILRILYQTSNAVAIGMPWVAEGKAILVAKQYQPTVDSGFMLSISLVPGKVESAIGGLVASDKKTTAGGGTAAGGSTKKPSKGGQRWGLPVQDDEYANLCKRAAKNVTHLVFAPFKFLPGFGTLAGAVEKFAGGLVSSFVGAFPGYFCGDMSDMAKGFSDTVKDKLLKSGKDKAKDLCDKRKKEAAAENKKRKKEGLPPVAFDFDKCMEATEKAFGALEAPGGPTLGEGKTSKMVYEAATLGDDYFAIWGFGFGDLSDQTGAEKGVNIAGWNKATAAGPSAFSRIGLAKAEFYYEPKPGDPKKWDKNLAARVPFGLAGDGEGGLSEDAMWNMRWRARLRRLRLPIPSAGGILATKINSAIPKIPLFEELLKWPADKLGDLVDDKIGEAIAPLTTIIAH
ncbi:MAG: hypothetical protein HYV09_41120 [Deltaproteobacteria bacterium]|nr:hypothetical protein [Deltaproteobacteria bacterium]